MRDLLPYLNNFNFCFGLQTKYSNNMENEILMANKIRTCAYQGVRNVRFSVNLACFVLLKHPF